MMDDVQRTRWLFGAAIAGAMLGCCLVALLSPPMRPAAPSGHEAAQGNPSAARPAEVRPVEVRTAGIDAAPTRSAESHSPAGPRVGPSPVTALPREPASRFVQNETPPPSRQPAAPSYALETRSPVEEGKLTVSVGATSPDSGAPEKSQPTRWRPQEPAESAAPADDASRTSQRFQLRSEAGPTQRDRLSMSAQPGVESKLADVRVAAVSQRTEGAGADGNRTSFTSDDRLPDVPASRVFPISYASTERLQRAIEPLLTEGVGTVGAASADARGAESGGGAPRRSLVVRDYPAVLQKVGRALTEIDRPASQRLMHLTLLQVARGPSARYAVDFETMRRRQSLARVRGVAALCPGAAPGSPAGTATLKFGLVQIAPDELFDGLRSFGPVATLGQWTTLVDPPRECRLTLGRRGDQVAALLERGGAVPADRAARLGLCLTPAADGSTRVGLRYLSPLPADPAAKEGKTRESRAVLIVPPGGTLLVGGLAPGGEFAAPDAPRDAGRPSAAGSAELPVELLALVQLRESGDEAASQSAQDPQDGEARRQTAQQYVAAAQSAAAGGKAADAEWLTACSLRFDPANREAVDLRNSLWLSQAATAFAACDGVLTGVSTTPLDGPAIAAWLLDDVVARRSPARSVAPTGYSQSPREITPGPVAP